MTRLIPLLILAALPAIAGAADDPRVVFHRAEQLAAQDKPGEAEPLFQEAIRGGDRFTQRQSYLRLIALYVQSGWAEKGVRLSEEFRAWLRKVGDDTGEADLDVLVGECYAALAHYETADRAFVSALKSGRGLTSDGRLAALRGRAEVAEQRMNPADAATRWAELETAARDAATVADKAGDTTSRVKALRYLAEALRRQGKAAAALAVLDPLPDLHDRIGDPLGRRDAQRQRANLLAAANRFKDAAPLFAEALAAHRRHRSGRRITTGDILSEWAEAAEIAGQKDEAKRLRTEAEEIYLAVLAAPKLADHLDGGPLAAFVRLQILTRSARQFRKALELSRGPGEQWSADALLEKRVKADRGELELLAAAYPTAKTLLTKVMRDVAASNPPDLRILPQLLVLLAAIDLADGRPDSAEPLLRQCAALYLRHSLPADVVLVECDYFLGGVATQQGDFAAAMTHYRRGLAASERVGAKAEPVRFTLLLSMALIHKDQNEATLALRHLEQAAESLAKYAETDDPSFGVIAAARADLHLVRRQVADAIRLLPEIEQSCEKNAIRGGYVWGTGRHLRAMELWAARKDTDAAAVWTALADAQRGESTKLLARTLNHLGLVAESGRRTDDAKRFYEDARQFLAARSGAPMVTQSLTLWRLAVLADQAGDRVMAKKRLEEVFDLADHARIGTFGEAGQRAEFFAQFREAFELLARWQARDGETEALVRTITRTRSRTLLDQMLAAGVDPRAGPAGPGRDAMLTREADARRAVSRLRAKLHFSPADDAARRKVLADLDAAQAEYEAAWREIVNADPTTRELIAAGRDAALPPNLPPKTAVLVYMLGREESYALLYPSPADRPILFRLSLSRRVAESIGEPPPQVGPLALGLRGLEVKFEAEQPEPPAKVAEEARSPLTDVRADRLVTQYLRLLGNPRFAPTRGFTVETQTPNQPTVERAELPGDCFLPRALLDRIREAKADQLVVVPDGALHKLPLEALVLSADPTPRYALDELPPVVYSPSLAILGVVCARERLPNDPPTLLTVGDPAYPIIEGPAKKGALVPLPGTAEESKRVRAAFDAERTTHLERATATKQNVVAAISGKRIVHLAAHGFADERFGNLFAAIALTPSVGATGPDDDGFLYLHEIQRLQMNGCDLTVLSACVTNVGPQRPLEAGVTLAGAFLSAGSRRVLATCRNVDDRATAELMGDFFARVGPANPNPVGHALALKQARQHVRDRKGWESPFYWAPFVLVGRPD